MVEYQSGADPIAAEPAAAEDGDAVPVPEDAPAAGRRRSSRSRGRPGTRKRVLAAVAAGISVLILVLMAMLPPVRTVLRQSFTRQPAAYTEMYFSGKPVVSGILLTIPVTVVDHGTGAKSFVLKVWTTDGGGKAGTPTSITVTPQHGSATTVVKLSIQLPAYAQVLWVNLAGREQTLHYRIAGEAIASESASPSASPSAGGHG